MRSLSGMALWLCLACGALLPASALAGDALSDIQRQLLNPVLLRGEFKQSKQVPGFKKPLISSGSFAQWREHGIVWQTRQPFASQLVLSRERLSAQSGAATYQLDAQAEPALQMINTLLFALLSGDIEYLKQYFVIEVDASEGPGWSLRLRPKDDSLARLYKQISLRGQHYVHEVHLEASNGDLTHIEFGQFEEENVPSAEEARLLGR